MKNKFETGDMVEWIHDVAWEDNTQGTKAVGFVLEQNVNSKIVKVFWTDKMSATWCFHSHLVKLA